VARGQLREGPRQEGRLQGRQSRGQKASQKDARRLHAREATFAGPPKAAPTMNGRRRTLNPPVGPFTAKFLDAGRRVTRRDAQQRIKVSRRVFTAVIDSDQGFRRKLGLSNGGITP
jgi:hypothetical protein